MAVYTGGGGAQPASIQSTDQAYIRIKNHFSGSYFAGWGPMVSKLRFMPYVGVFDLDPMTLVAEDTQAGGIVTNDQILQAIETAGNN